MEIPVSSPLQRLRVDQYPRILKMDELENAITNSIGILYIWRKNRTIWLEFVPMLS